jgi:protein-S-isoprenylcysteine O-methyltransferase Ste14
MIEVMTAQPPFNPGQRLANFGASFALILTTYLIYDLLPYYQTYTSEELHILSLHFVNRDVLQFVYVSYSILLLIYYLIEKSPQISKSIYCLRAIKRIITAPLDVYRGGLPAQERLSLLTILLKAFFAPLMVAWLTPHMVHMIDNGIYLATHLELLQNDFLAVFNYRGFWFLLQVILSLDVFFFTIGYLIELPGLKNQIRSVDPTLFGWAVALACYPPFNGLTSKILAWEPVDFPQFDTPAVHIMVNFLLLGLMAIYTSASVALNFKASNLTHRGIIATGPYRFIRHPAYACKNLAWWTGSIPALIAGIQTSLWSTVLVLSSVGGWTLIYTLRALTEEDHLRKIDEEYDRYCEKVKYRFIPGVL